MICICEEQCSDEVDRVVGEDEVDRGDEGNEADEMPRNFMRPECGRMI